MPIQSETYFMNNLSPSLRPAALKLYLKEELDSLIEMRFTDVPSYYQDEFLLSNEKWLEVLNAVVLTRISQFNLGNHLVKERLNQMHQLVWTLLQTTPELNDKTEQEILAELETSAKLFVHWHANLNKLAQG